MINIKLEFQCDLKKIQEIAKIRKISLNANSENAILKSAEDNKSTIARKWKENERLLVGMLNDILPGLDNNYNIKVFVFPKEIPIGACNCDTREILFGYREEYIGFCLVVICHEIAHILIYNYRKKKLISRLTDETVAFLVAECEVRKVLTGCEYFSPFFKGKLSNLHSQALCMALKNIEIWNSYLQKSRKNIGDLLLTLEKHVSKTEREKYENVQLKEFLN